MKKAFFAFVVGVLLFIFTSQITFAQEITKERILHFPADYSLGSIFLRDAALERKIETFLYWVDGVGDKWQYIGAAMGDVRIPAGKYVKLIISLSAYRNPENLSGLKNLAAYDIHTLIISDLYAPPNSPKPNDKCMPYIAHLTGLKELNLDGANISDKGLKYISEMNSLEILYPPRLTSDAALAQIVKIKSLKAIPAGKRVQLVVSMTLYRTPQRLAALEKIGADDLYSLVMQEGLEPGERPADAVMVHIAHLKGLRELGLSGNISGKGLAQITGMQQLEELTAPRLVYAEGMRHIAEQKGLKRLYFRSSGITNENLKLIAGLKELEELDLADTNVNDDGLRYLAEFPKLYYLHLNGKFTDEGLKHLKNCPSLRILKLHFKDNNLTDTGLMNISQIKTLEALWVHWMDKITDKGIEYLAELPNLKKIDLGFAELTDNACKILQKSRTIECIEFPAKGFSDNASEYLKEIKNLKVLTIGCAGNSPLTDRTLQNISKLENLETLHVAGKGFTDEGVRYISGLKKLKDLSLFVAPGMTNTGLSSLSGLKNLEKLYLPMESRITIDGLKFLNTLEKLEHLDAACAEKDAILDIKGLKSIKDLGISFIRKSAANNSFVDEDLICLKNLVKLEQLRLGKAHIGDNGLKHLNGLTNLYNIFVSETEITDEGLKSFYDMKRLDSIGIYGSHITDLGLLYLQDLKSLQSIEITTDQIVSQKAINKLRKEVPRLFRCEIKTQKPQQKINQ